MIDSRKAFPWALSALLHLIVLLLPVGVLLAPAVHRVRPAGIDVTITGSEAVPGVAGAAMSLKADPGAPDGVSPARLPAVAVPQAVRADANQVPAARPFGVLLPEGSRAMSHADSTPVPSAEEVLADLTALAPSDAGEGALAEHGAGSPGVAGAQIGWEGTPRSLIRRRDPQFPAVLSAAGQEVEGEARITVAPSGAVIRVEITRSTGYIEIDASIESALFDYLFSRADGRADAAGTVRFHFRLEKQD